MSEDMSVKRLTQPNAQTVGGSLRRLELAVMPCQKIVALSQCNEQLSHLFPEIPM
jgi:hypothetical protein